ncbi:MAG: nucleotide exchange factor GrpE [Myxococcota bacterium]
MSKDQSRNALDEAMAEALESVEKRERASQDDEEGVEVEVQDEVTESDDEPEAANESQQELKEQMLRLAADFDNYRKRSRREVDDAKRFGIEALLRDVLPVMDNFERALATTPEDDDHPLVQGIKMVKKQFIDVLDQYGVKGFDSLGLSFDPELHEALSQMPSAEHGAGTILNEHERGYMIHDRLLRPARVVVAMPPPQETQEAEGAVEEEETDG